MIYIKIDRSVKIDSWSLETHRLVLVTTKMIGHLTGLFQIYLLKTPQSISVVDQIFLKIGVFELGLHSRLDQMIWICPKKYSSDVLSHDWFKLRGFISMLNNYNFCINIKTRNTPSEIMTIGDVIGWVTWLECNLKTRNQFWSHHWKLNMTSSNKFFCQWDTLWGYPQMAPLDRGRK